MKRLGLDTAIVDQAVYGRAIDRFREAGILLPTFAQLTHPTTIPAGVRARLASVDPDAAHALNLFRVHWHNDVRRTGVTDVPGHVVLPSSLTGVRAPIVVAFGDRFPMIAAHKVLAAYACLAPRVITGQFDPTAHRALWPSTGNYCRGGVAISRIMECHGVAILPEGMSAERFDWLRQWVVDPADIIRTPGTESNVKEIYDKCAELEQDPANAIFNQFCEFGNYLAHFACTGAALERVFEHLRQSMPALRLHSYISATGSGGTLAAGDYLKERLGARIVAVEALECPTLLYNGFGEHNIQGIGDKHVPLIHNVMNTDVVTAISDEVTDGLGVLFSSEVGHRYLRDRRDVPQPVLDVLCSLGLSSICNVLAAIKTARYFDLGPDEAVVTVATDGSGMYASEWPRLTAKHFGGHFDEVTAAEVFGRAILGATTDHYLEMTARDRDRVFNLGYYTWVEQQGVSLAEFTVRRDQAFWRDLRGYLDAWDALIGEFNARTGVTAA